MSDINVSFENQEGKVATTINGISYNLEKPDIIIDGGGIIGGNYQYNNDDTLCIPGSPVINAVDIAWNAHLPLSGADIETTSDLLKQIDANQSSIPILDNYTVENTDNLPDKFISINTGRDLQLAGDENYLDILFSAIRSLQAEVAKLRNTFKYGLNSYNDTNTALGNVVTEYTSVTEDEPLWAIEEEDLPAILDFDFPLTLEHLLVPKENIIVHDDHLEITDTSEFKSCTSLNTITDPKVILYFTTENLNLSINLINRNNEEETLNINLADYNINTVPAKYNIMFILSRQVKDSNNNLIGNNYIYVSIGEYINGQVYKEGYYNPTTNNLQTLEYNLNDIYDITNITFGENKIWKLNAYYKEQDFTKEVIPSTPSDQDYKYEVAHITIRSVKTFEILNSIKDKLQENELVFVKATNNLYIKTNENIIKIGSSSGSDDTPIDDNTNDMTQEQQELLERLEKLGIVVEDDTININSGTSVINMATIGSITFVNEETGKKFTVSIDPHGNLVSNEINVNSLDSQITENIQKLMMENSIFSGENSELSVKLPENTGDSPIVKVGFKSSRGFVGLLNIAKGDEKTEGTTTNTTTKDAGLKSDRIKISSIYAPLATDTVHGCSHGFIELENLSDKDFPLDGVYLHYGKQKVSHANIQDDNYTKIYHLPLKGVLKANSTFLIRCAKYAEPSDVNTFIKVNSYDMEWYVREDYVNEKGKLLDLSEFISDTIEYIDAKDDQGNYIYEEDGVTKKQIINPATANNKFNYSYGFLLNYTNYKIFPQSNDINEIDDANYKTSILQKYLRDVAINDSFVKKPVDEPNTSNEMLKFATSKDYKYTYFIRRDLIDLIFIGGLFGNWIDTLFASDAKLQPAFKQYHNSIYRNTFGLDPAKQAYNSLHAKDSSRVRWANRNNDLNTLNLDKEFISFPKSALTKPVSDFTPRASFENKNVCTDKTQLDITKPNMVTCSYGMNIYTTRCFNWISAGLFDEFIWLYNENNELVGKFESYKDGDENIQAEEFTETKKYRRKHFGAEANNIIYKRITNRFPASNLQYTSHKCILEFVVGDIPVVYKYIVAREDTVNKNIPSSEYRSDEMELTIYPYSYNPKIYQTTDQQGFHWIEYQVWTAAANKIRQKIDFDLADGQHIIPIVINTGDMTQNGTRLNEWLDYYNGGYEIFKKYCQNNIVGNNDLCDVDVNILGIGDDPGKSNGYYFHIFNCVDVDEDNLPIVDKLTDSNGNILREAKVIPSLYYLNIDYKKNDDGTYDLTKPTKRMLMINSEITKTTCQNWYELNVTKTANNTSVKVPVNLYTGFTISNTANKSYWSYEAENLNFRTIYNMICKMTEDSDINSDIKYIAICHEMPFTVTTKKSLTEAEVGNEKPGNYRSISDEGKLVGCHMNQISDDDEAPGIYWFSRLLEYKNIHICIGGHKHTYAATYPLCENYYWYSDSDNKYVWSFLQPIPMAQISNNFDVEHPDDSNNPINKYSLEWELITEQQIKNRVNWIYNDETCPELQTWNEITINDIKVNQGDHKKYINNRNLSKFPICFTNPLDTRNRPGYVEDYVLEENSGNEENSNNSTRDKILLNTVFYIINGSVGDTYIYFPVHYAIINYDEEEYINEYINKYGDLVKNENNHPVRYFMMQATGYKLKSNKELPTAYQRYSEIIPKTTVDVNDDDSPAPDQQRPMYGEIYFTNESNKEYINLSIIRIDNILKSDFKFDQLNYGTDKMQLQFVNTFLTTKKDENRSFGEWINYGNKNDKIIDLNITESDDTSNGKLRIKNTITPLFKDVF